MTTPFPYKNFSRQRGFGLLEVMITVIVLSVALLALGGLHAQIIKSANDAKLKALATSLATEKIDDLRSYGATSADSSFTFDTINNSSSSTPGGNAGNTYVSDSNVTFTRRWFATSMYVCGDNAPSTSNCATPKTQPDMKVLNVSVTWTDVEGDPQSVAMQSIISFTETGAAKNIIGPSSSGGPYKVPNPSYTEADQDISHDLGDVLKRVSQPVPDTNRSSSQSGDNDITSNTVTSFREEYYNSSNQLIGENEFVTVNCYCAQQASTGTGYEPTYLKNNKYVAGNYVSKHVGTVDTGSGLNDQPAVCTICCRDHHDTSTAAHLYDPFRPTTDFSSGNHNHYPASSAPGFSSTANTGTSSYAEACRMAWVGGKLKTLQDWRLESLQILPKNYLATSTQLTAYTDYVSSFITQFVMSIGTSYPSTMPDRTAILASNTSRSIIEGTSTVTLPGVATTLGVLATSTTSTTTSVASSASASDWDQLSVRGIYIDYMDFDLINTIRCKIDPANTPLAGGTYSSCSEYGVTAKSDYLYLIPFHDVNLTKLAQWTTTNASSIAVKSDRLLDGNESTFARGKIAGVTSGTKAGIKATIQTSNTGLTVSEAIDPEDYSSSVNPITDCIAVIYGSSTAADPCTTVTATVIQGTVSIGTGSAKPSGGITASDVYITVKSSGGSNLCTVTVKSTGVYDTTDCGSALADATALQLYIWKYTTTKTNGVNDNCVLIQSTTLSSYTTSADASACTGTCTSSDYFSPSNSQGEYTQINFSGLTANSTVTFNFKIDGDDPSASQCSN
jgi:prepilin-type N-terminal cleavage/methylation domain-containing protein